ncbi:ABC-type nitrate/sulfonate/bicarbonate transport system, permease component [Sanguibacter keddieii DSM 10542]|uniref:ABC-type nitrate/sulfonate/bicarbonate transport system, permease component n=1 Tax=Sanguibacter keddieii (strain ATCC 51767 / DSM 10542 / NCFB 3025 / ST-74) TaxID=446469 RepID=D1BJD6_SANKS|nr:ABC transporter permease subunit [Sanguibacter keddieii]ACZ22330.1 ABC-type nitrate/sulfonate/bicarbonate transport system, permease component [Sanguibacter keddieii DSM 10542]
MTTDHLESTSQPVSTARSGDTVPPVSPARRTASGRAVARSTGAVLASVAPPVVLLAALLAAWQAAVTLGDVPAFVLPGPSAIFSELRDLAGPITSAALVTGRNALVGLVVGALLGVLLAVVASSAQVVDRLGEPVVTALSVVPVVALAPVLYSMYGAASEQARVIVAGLAVFVPVYVNTLRGLRQVTPVHRDLMRALAASPRQVALTVTVPTAVPFVFTGLRIASSLAVISAIVAEYFGGPRSGIGSFITTAASGSNYARAWAYVLGGIVVGLVFFTVTALAEHLATRRKAR